MAEQLPPEKINIKNKKAFHEYEIIEKFEAGMQLTGSEIKSIRMGKASIKEAYCYIHKGELFVKSMHIASYEKAAHYDHDPKRDRKLLLRKEELNKLTRKVKTQGVTIIPLKLYIVKSGYAKLQVALAKGKKLHDKRESIKEKDLKREMDRAKKGD